MHVAAIEADALGIEAQVEAAHRPQEATGLTGIVPQGIQVGAAEEALLGHVQPYDHHGPGGGEHPIGRLGIVVNVGLGIGGHVAAMAVDAKGASHHHHLLHQRGDLGGGLERQRQVGEGPDCHQGDLAGVGLHRLDDVLPGRARIRRQGHLPRLHITQPARAVHHSGRPHGLAQQRRGGALGHLCLHAVFLLEPEGVAGPVLYGGVAKHCRDGEQVDGGVGLGKEYCHGVVDTGIGIQNDLVGHGASIRQKCQCSDLGPV
ncbi:hypothetical protein D3C86_1233840 [compost metagenome]